MPHASTRQADIRPVATPPPAREARAAPCSHCRLAPTCLPARLGPEDVARLGAVVHLRAPLARGQRLFREGESPERLFIVRSGCLRSSVVTGDGGEQVVGFHPPGDVVGFDTSLDTFRHSTAIALERTSVCAVALDELRRLSGTVPGLQEQLYRLIGRELAGNRQHLLMMGRMGSYRRLALFLRTWSWRMAAAGFPGDELPLPMSRDDIASYLGLAQETVSRAVSRLQERGIVRVQGRHVRITDPERLAEAGGMEPLEPA